MNRLYIECDCGSPDHLIMFWRDDEDLGVNVQMNSYLPWWRRLIVAARFIAGLDSGLHWADALLSVERRSEVAQFLVHPGEAVSVSGGGQ